jgi:hypothetical protein
VDCQKYPRKIYEVKPLRLQHQHPIGMLSLQKLHLLERDKAVKEVVRYQRLLIVLVQHRMGLNYIIGIQIT